jgi:hypothetical protein
MRVWEKIACAMSVGIAIAACSAQANNRLGGDGGGDGSGGASASASSSSGDGGINLGTGGSSSGTGVMDGGECAAVSQTATNQFRPVDIIWAIDTSDSMVNELQAVEDNMNQFAGTILNQGIDVHVVVIAKPGKPDGGNSNGFGPVFTALAQTVIDGKELDCAWAIPPVPAGQMFDAGKVNVNYTPSGGAAQPVFHVSTEADCGPQGGWFYDNNASPTTVKVCPSTCSTIKADQNGKIDILFGCATLDVPQ